jgi:hypothetical protein
MLMNFFRTETAEFVDRKGAPAFGGLSRKLQLRARRRSVLRRNRVDADDHNMTVAGGLRASSGHWRAILICPVSRVNRSRGGERWRGTIFSASLPVTPLEEDADHDLDHSDPRRNLHRPGDQRLPAGRILMR